MVGTSTSRCTLAIDLDNELGYQVEMSALLTRERESRSKDKHKVKLRLGKKYVNLGPEYNAWVLRNVFKGMDPGRLLAYWEVQARRRLSRHLKMCC